MSVHTMKQVSSGCWSVGVHITDSGEHFFSEVAENLSAQDALQLVNFLNGGEGDRSMANAIFQRSFE